MSIQNPLAPDATAGRTAPPGDLERTGRFGTAQFILIGLGGLILLSFVRAVTGASPLTAGGTVGATVALAVPIGLAGLGGLWSERS
ncbi:MAG: ral nucleoside transport system permease protein, partial [Pseudonocardiales bacterium]|nr:ral nucleoside transport system permease protein [Pseudonocardiales bacterium]